MNVLEKFEKILAFRRENEDVVDESCKAVTGLATVVGDPG